MGQEVKNLFRAQSKYGLMGSSAKTGKNFFEGHRSTFLHKVPFAIGHPPPDLHIKCSLHMCGRVQGSQIFKENSIILIHSKVIAFLVILLSPWSPRCLHIVPTLSPHCVHVVPIIPMLSPLSSSSSHHPYGSHIIPTPTYPLHPPSPSLEGGDPQNQ